MKAAFTEKLLFRFGRRGTVLGLFGLVWILYGLSFVTSPAYRFGNLGPIASQVLNSPWLGWIWGVAGGVALAVALLPRRKSDTTGFVALLIPAFIWTALFTTSWMFSVFTADYGDSHSWVGSLVWVLDVITILVCASWPDPGETRE